MRVARLILAALFGATLSLYVNYEAAWALAAVLFTGVHYLAVVITDVGRAK